MSNVFEISNIQYKISIRVEKTLTVFVQGDFFNWASPENVSRLAPPINPLTGRPLNHQSMRITKHLDFLLSLGGASLGLYRFF